MIASAVIYYVLTITMDFFGMCSYIELVGCDSEASSARRSFVKAHTDTDTIDKHSYLMISRSLCKILGSKMTVQLLL